jgi:follistatin-related protein 5
MVTNDGEEPHAKCICQRKCPHHSSKKHLLCGSDGNLYANRCALRRAECLTNQKIHLRNYVMCISTKKIDKSKVTVTPQNNNKLMTKDDQPEARTYHLENATQASTVVPNIRLTTILPNYITLAEQQDTTESLTHTASPMIGSSSTVDKVCSSQEYEIMKDNLLLFSHTRLLVESNNHSKNFLVSIMFSHYDQNNDGYLERDEIVEVSKSENIRVLSNGCNLEDMLSYEDNEDADDRLSINEFNQAFSKLYSNY